VTLEVLDASGAVAATFTNDPNAAAAGRGGGRGAGGAGRGGGAAGGAATIPNTTALWRATPEPFSGEPGLHRVNWSPGGGGGRGGGRGGQARGAPLGPFTARLTVNGQVLTQTFTIQPDPRVK